MERNEKGCDIVCVQMFGVSASKSKTSSTIWSVKSHSGSKVEVRQYWYGFCVWSSVSNSALGLLYGHGILTIYENLLL